MSKKVLSLVLALVMVLGTFGTAFAASYPDTDNTVYADAVDRLSEIGILKGYPDGSFKPEGQITRAEFAAVAVRAKGLESAATAAKGLATGFTDVPTAHWASGYVGTAGRLGIINGVGGGLFAPEAPVKYEEAVTMMVRALGYEVAAQAKGGYPYGYLIVANEVGLLDAVKGTQGVAATRGIVAQITDNALEIEMMIQVGFGVDTKWVVSGTEDTNEKYLLDELGFDSVTGRTTKVSSSRKNITVTIEKEDEQKRLDKKSVSINVPAGFDVYEVEGVEAKLWYKEGLVIAKVLEDAKFDAVEYIAKDKELNLITEDEGYEVAAKSDLYELTLNGDKVDAADFKADYAKVVLNDDEEIIWAQGYKLDGFVVVDKVNKFDVIGADEHNEVDVKDFIIVKDGKEISAEDLKEGDVLYYNEAEEFAVVSNNSKKGEINRVYDTAQSVRFDGTNYDVADDAIYLNDEGKVGDLDNAILEDIMDEEEEVTIFFNFKNEVVVVLAGPESGTSAYYVLRADSNIFPGRRGNLLGLDLRDSKGAKVDFDLDGDFFTDGNFTKQNGDGAFVVDKSMTSAETLLKDGSVAKITLDKDGEPKEVVAMTEFTADDVIELKDTKVTDGKSYRLQSSTVVFYKDHEKAIRFGEVKDEFSKVKDGAKFFVEKGNVVAIVGNTDADTDTVTVSGLLESAGNVRKLRSGQWEVKIRVLGTNKTYITKDDNLADPFTALVGKVINIEIGEKSGEIEKVDGVVAEEAEKVTGKVTSAVSRTITIDGKDYTLNTGYKAYDANFKEINLSATKDKNVTLYMDGNSARFANYVIVAASGVTPPATTGVVTYINAVGTRFEVDGIVYTIDENTILKENGATIAIGIDAIKAKLVEGDKVSVEKNVITRTFSQAVADVEAALTAYNAAKAAVVEANYTTASWATYKAVVDANVVTNQNTVAQINTAKTSITAAQANLVKVANLTAYNAAKAAVVEANYTTASWATYKAVVDANVVTNQDTQAAVDLATAKITVAQADLVLEP